MASVKPTYIGFSTINSLSPPYSLTDIELIKQDLLNAFNTKKITGQDVIDFIEFRRRQAQGDAFDAEFMAAVLGKPKD